MDCFRFRIKSGFTRKGNPSVTPLLLLSACTTTALFGRDLGALRPVGRPNVIAERLAFLAFLQAARISDRVSAIDEATI